MSRFTVYRADVESPRVARVLRKIPGITVPTAKDSDRPGEAGDEVAEDTDVAVEDDDGGLREKMPMPDIGPGESEPETDPLDEDETSVVKAYGLLGLGVSMVVLGFATVGIWVYLRRRGGESESETPPPTTGVDTPSTGTATSSAATGTETELSVAPSDEESESADDDEPYGRTEDREDVEWTTKDRTPDDEPEPTEPLAEAEPDEEGEHDEDDEPDDGARPGESVDAAPLLGAAFVAVTGVVVRWLQSGEDET